MKTYKLKSTKHRLGHFCVRVPVTDAKGRVVGRQKKKKIMPGDTCELEAGVVAQLKASGFDLVEHKTRKPKTEA